MTELNDDASFRDALLRSAAAAMPDALQRSSVALVRGNNPVVEQLGSGTLFAVADRRFVVTAAHVVARARELDAIIGVSNHNGGFVAAPGQWVVSVKEGSTDHSLVDVAVYPLSEAQSRDLEGRTFLRIHDIDFSADLTRSYFVMFGYPQMFCRPSTREDERMELGALQFATPVYIGDTRGLAGYDREIHLLFDAQEDYLYDHNGRDTALRGAHGVRIPFPGGVTGISGCAVWRLGKLSQKLSSWQPKDARVVAVQTGFYENRHAIKATRWSLVTTLIASRYPELSAAIRLHE